MNIKTKIYTISSYRCLKYSEGVGEFLLFKVVRKVRWMDKFSHKVIDYQYNLIWQITKHNKLYASHYSTTYIRIILCTLCKYLKILLYIYKYLFIIMQVYSDNQGFRGSNNLLYHLASYTSWYSMLIFWCVGEILAFEFNNVTRWCACLVMQAHKLEFTKLSISYVASNFNN